MDNIVFDWNFNPLTCYTHQGEYQDVVFVVHWQFTGMSGSLQSSSMSYSSTVIGTQTFTFNPTQSSFIPFNELTKDIVLGWVTGSMGSDAVETMKTSITAQIQEQITPKVINLSPPWITGSI